MRANLFVAANLLIATDYLLIGLMFGRRIRLPRAGARLAFVAYVSMALFFLLCMHTHLSLAYVMRYGISDPHWTSTPDILSHVAQGIGGLVFWYLARKHLHILITDKTTYDRANDAQTEARLQYLAAKAGLR